MDIKNRTKVLVVDDEKHIAEICAHFLKSDGWNVDIVHDVTSAIILISRDKNYSIVYLDIRLPDMSGIEVLKEIKKLNPLIDIIMMTAYATVDNVIECLKAGACDFIIKPFKREIILQSVDRAVQIKKLRNKVERLHHELKAEYKFDNIVGNSPKMQEIYKKIFSVAGSDEAILILGESGTGKDLIARTIHYNSPRSKGPFVAINCAALPRELIESELFGYKKGAFTGAGSDAIGLFRAAEGGTVFLDEIVEMPTSAQSKLLRTLQEKKVRPVGDTNEINVDVRVICATNKDIELAVKEGSLRQDLYYRINTIVLEIPPLRERKEDIPILIEHFISKINKETHKSIKGISQEALDILIKHKWEGNVRELENVIRSAIALGRKSIITTKDIPKYIMDTIGSKIDEEVDTLENMERQLIHKAIKITRNNKSKTAKLLGITRKRLYRLMDKYNLR